MTELNDRTVNRGKVIYYKNKAHYIVYEFDDVSLVSKSKDLKKVFSVKKSQLSYKKK